MLFLMSRYYWEFDNSAVIGECFTMGRGKLSREDTRCSQTLRVQGIVAKVLVSVIYKDLTLKAKAKDSKFVL